ncbi:MAG: recombination mediator RecR [Patescibacteria group bacterium]|nr:recombination mediator RecR [Patescibacteria group bacterium]MDD4611328.1 recombination mediator RecR [Patescibacteria group bacterium]
MRYPQSIQNLIDEFSQLPTVGPKTAERYVFYLLKQNPEKLQQFAQAIAELKEKITICQSCLAVADTNPCPICADGKRDKKIICVVAKTRDLITIEDTKQYNGLYFILGGLINALADSGPDNLNVKKLVEKIKNNGVEEIILALNPTVEGETTAMYLTKLLKPLNVKITRLAKGLPMGADLEYADEITLSNALKYRTDL